MFEFSDKILHVVGGLVLLGAIAPVVLPMIGAGIAGLVMALAPAAPAMIAVGYAMLPFAAGLMAIGIAVNFMGSGLKSLAEGFQDFPYKHVVDTALALMIASPMLLVAGTFMLVAGVLLGPAGLLVGMGLQSLGKGVSAFVGEGILSMLYLLGPALIVFSMLAIPAGYAMLIAGLLLGPGALLVGMGLGTLAGGIAPFVDKGMIKAMYRLGPALIIFSALLIPAGYMMLIAGALMLPAGIMTGIGLDVLATGIEAFTGRKMIKTMALLGPALILFSASTLLAAVALLPAAVLMLPAGIMMGIGLSVLGDGLKEMKRTGGTMVMMSIVLPFFAASMIIAGALLTVAGPLIMVGGILTGIGLAGLGLGLNVWDGGTITNALLVGPVLLVLSTFLLAASIPLLVASVLFTPAAVLIGIGLAILGASLLLWDGGTLASAALVGPALMILAVSLLIASPALLIAGVFFVPAALLVGLGLGILGLSLQLFDKNTVKAAFMIGPALLILSASLLMAAPALLLAGVFFVPGALLVGMGLLLLGTSIRLIRKSIRYMARIGPALVILADGLLNAAPKMYLAGFFFAPAALMLGGPMIVLALGLRALGKGLRKFSKGGLQALQLLGPALFWFALALLPASLMMIVAAPAFAVAAALIIPGAILMAFAMGILAIPLMRVSFALAMILPHAAGMPALALGLLLLGPALVSFGFGLFMLGVFASLPFFNTGLDVFITALWAMAMAFQAIPTEKAVALGMVFQGLAAMTDLENAGNMLFEVAMGIFWIARALETLPEEKTISMALLATNMSGLISAAVQLKPENVEAVEGVVKAAAEYANVASEMPTPDMDPFVQALKSALGLGGEGGGGGQDIVLELNGRELGRAIDAHIEGNHGLDIG